MISNIYKSYDENNAEKKKELKQTKSLLPLPLMLLLQKKKSRHN